MKFYDGIYKLISRNDPASVSSLAFLLLVLSIIGWEWYAIGSKTTVPHIEALLAFALAVMVNKHVKDCRKGGNSGTPGVTE
jgi:hypothetical protein